MKNTNNPQPRPIQLAPYARSSFGSQYPGHRTNRAKCSARYPQNRRLTIHDFFLKSIWPRARPAGSFSEGGQYVVRQRIDCLRGFTMKRRERGASERASGRGRERHRYSVYKEEKGTPGRTVMESERDNNRAESERGGG